MKNKILQIIVAALWACVFSWPVQAEPVGTSFTYQGRLTDGGNPANGTHEFEFHLYDAPTAGTFLGTETVEEVPVVDGIFTVQLDFGAAAFNGQRRWLEIWVRNDTDGQPGESLAPRQEITAAPYAMMAAKVPADSITDVELANGAVTSGKLANGAVTAGKLGTGAVSGSNIANGAITNANISTGAIQSQNLATGSVGPTQLANGAVSNDKLATNAAFQNLLNNGQSPVGGSGIIMSQLAAATELISGGFKQIGQATLVEESWVNKASAPDAPPAFNMGNDRHAAVWTGTEMLIWGGTTNQGGKYNPTTNTWTPMSTVNAPAARQNPTAIWTGTEMIVWGGFDGNYVNTGGRYNPATNTWTALPTTGAPTGRRYHTAVWTGSRMVIWGGTTSGGTVATGALYNPTNNTWATVSLAGTAPQARSRHFAFWSTTTNRMYVVGDPDVTNVNRVDIYDPAANSWTAVDPGLAGVPIDIVAATWTGTEILMVERGSFNGIVRFNVAASTLTRVEADRSFSDTCTIVWDGTRAIIWGAAGDVFNSGTALYTPSTNTFSTLSETNAPLNKTRHTAVWTGSRMIVWGGVAGLSGGSYNPVANAWELIAGLSAGGKRASGFSQVWTGSDMIIWGGIDGGNTVVQGGLRYNLAANTWVVTSNTNAPSARVNHTAVWSGTEMIVWGGGEPDGEEFFYDGARYNPATDTWTALPSLGAPGIDTHQAIWTGTEMIVIGAGVGSMQGARYNPATNTWTPLSTSNAPANRSSFVLAWTGTEAILWGGINGTLGNSTGARYNPTTNTWTAMTNTNAPPGRANPAYGWSGSELIVFGGGSEFSPYATVNGRYNPTSNTWTTISSTNAPSARSDISFAWDGTRLIAWGGKSSAGAYLSDGKLYSPDEEKWSGITNADPSERSGAKAVWTGTSMLIFGGMSNSGAQAETYNYTPERNFYFYVRP